VYSLPNDRTPMAEIMGSYNAEPRPPIRMSPCDPGKW
jgi:hypothetical protein